MAIDQRAIEVIEGFRGDRSINQFARDLDLDPAQLWRVLNGQQSPNRVIVALLRAYPEQGTDIAAALTTPEAAPEAVPA